MTKYTNTKRARILFKQPKQPRQQMDILVLGHTFKEELSPGQTVVGRRVLRREIMKQYPGMTWKAVKKLAKRKKHEKV